MSKTKHRTYRKQRNINKNNVSRKAMASHRMPYVTAIA